jgi:hypothetical protein
MIGVKIQGRLGNQLFQYTYAKVLAEKFNTQYFLIRYKDFYAHKYFELEMESRFANGLKIIWFYLRGLFNVKTISEDQFSSPLLNISKEEDNSIYNGFYQSALYHPEKSVKSIKETLSIRPAYRISIRDYVGNEKPTIVVHVRRTDYLTFGGDHVGGINLTLPETYYQEALSKLPTLECNVLFLSDDIAFVKQQFKVPNAIYAERNSEIVDFQLIMQADYLILANSSFSWWGAYLNKGAKKVIAPMFWLGIKINKEYPVGINCADWITL